MFLQGLKDRDDRVPFPAGLCHGLIYECQIDLVHGLNRLEVLDGSRATVAQTCSLPYRRFLTCGASENSSAFERADALPIANRRYGRCLRYDRTAAASLSKNALVS